jgi:hypothetical protein
MLLLVHIIASTRSTALSAPFRNLLKLAVGIITALTGTAAPRADVVQAGPTPRVEVLTLPAFIARIRRDAELRASFAQDPRTTLREFGIDPGPINLPEQLTEAQLQSLLDSWMAVDRSIRTAANDGRDLPLQIAAPSISAAPVYGPPPSPPAPVYGPPGTPSPKPTGRPR